MISRLSTCALLAITLASPLAANAWTHPGVLISQSQIDFVKQQIRAGAEP